MGGKSLTSQSISVLTLGKKQQLKDFVEDIENQKPDRSYFFGTILFQARPRRERFEIIDIVDGQQRITTLNYLYEAAFGRTGKIRQRCYDARGYLYPDL